MTCFDQLGRAVHVAKAPQRIISVVPSQTELLWDLGLKEQIVGITKFCVHPEECYRSKKRIGGTKNLILQEIISLKPDIIFANKEENDKSQIEKLSAEIPTWVSDVKSIDDNLSMIDAIAEICQVVESGKQLREKIVEAYAPSTHELSRALRVAYLIWNQPLMVAGGGTFIDHMLQQAGFQNAFGNQPRYPEVSIDELRELKLDVLLLSSEPFPFGVKHQKELASRLSIPSLLVDGEMFSWYGSRPLLAANYFRDLRSQMAVLIA